MKIIDQILWRIKFLMFHSWGMNLSIILYTVFPFFRGNLDFRTQILEKKRNYKMG